MKKSDYWTMRWLLLLAVMLLLNACSDTDAPGDQKKERAQLELKPYASSYVEEMESDVTRSWTPPSPYVIYDNLNSKFTSQKDLMKKSISVFFTKDDEDPMEGTFFYRNSDSKWQLSMEVTAGDYYLYGFIPKEDAMSSTIAPNTTYSDGAVLTINGLQTVTPSDVCVLIGAKEGPDADHDGSDADNDDIVDDPLRPGFFKTNIKTTGVSGNNNFIYLLFDHLYASLRFRFKVDPIYAALRTIRLKKLELISYSSDTGGEVYAKFNVRITLKKTDDGSSPIVGSVVYTPDESSTSVPPVPIFEGDTKLKTDATTNFMGCFVPGDNTYFKLRSTYDVYDKNVNKDTGGNPILDEDGEPVGNLIRKDCQAENTIDLRKWFGNDLMTTRGHSYSLTITVLPTYLYVLSDPDLDNPTLTIN